MCICRPHGLSLVGLVGLVGLVCVKPGTTRHNYGKYSRLSNVSRAKSSRKRKKEGGGGGSMVNNKCSEVNEAV